jgi:endonuclease YncB( thermonuclease family)
VRTARATVAAVTAALVLTACLTEAEHGGAVLPAAAGTASASPSGIPAAPELRTAVHGDGDSWRDPDGREYRLGMVNAPEVGECFGAQATDERKRLTASGFHAQEYARDRYGRAVSVVHAADGTNVNVHLARHGLADDRYLAQFRHENSALAAELDQAYAAAKRERAGLWGACGRGAAQGGEAPPPAAAPAQPAPARSPTGSCHPDYATCIAVKGDGSGRGAANDLDCGEIGQAVTLRAAGVDPYRLDDDGDGTGCDS